MRKELTHQSRDIRQHLANGSSWKNVVHNLQEELDNHKTGFVDIPGGAAACTGAVVADTVVAAVTVEHKM